MHLRTWIEMLAPKSGCWLIIVLITSWTLQLDNGAQEHAYSGRTSPILIELLWKLAQTKRLDASTNTDWFICWLRSLVVCWLRCLSHFGCSNWRMEPRNIMWKNVINVDRIVTKFGSNEAPRYTFEHGTVCCCWVDHGWSLSMINVPWSKVKVTNV